MDEYLEAFKRRKRGYNKESSNSSLKPLVKKWPNFLSKFLISVIFFLVSVIFINQSDKNLFLYQDYVFKESLPFTKIKKWYEDLFGEVLPKEDPAQTVFNGKLVYKDISDYLDGSKLTLNSHTLINNLTSGIVVFIGEKEGYGQTVIVQGIDGADIWYGNLTNISVKLYDYLAKETVLGEVDGEELYLVIKKDNEYLKYEEYQNS